MKIENWMNNESFMGKWRMLMFDILYSAMFIILTLISKSQFPIMIGLLITVFYLKFTQRQNFIINLIIAFFTALVWVYFAKQNYHYGKNFLEINGFCFYPVFLWGMALFGASLILSHLDPITKGNLLYKILLNTFLFSATLIIVEYSAYNIFNLKNQATIIYKPIPVINCIHAPVWMQIMYFLIGPIYGTLLYIIEFISEKEWISSATFFNFFRRESDIYPAPREEYFTE